MKTAWLDDDKFHDECGLFGVFDHPEAANLAYLGLYALQHRGQESAGIAATDGPALHVEKAMGWVADVFSPERLRRLPGRAAIGHVRYSTAGSSTLRNAQPISASFSRGSIALGHNGNLVNAEALRKELEALGAIFQSTSDSEVILHLIARADRQSLERTLTQALAQLSGAYSLVMLTPDTLIGCRDPHGFRPLVVGRLGRTWLLASETCALDLLEAEYVRDVEPGEIVLIDQNGLRSMKPFPAKKQLQCVFEYVYFARPGHEACGARTSIRRGSRWVTGWPRSTRSRRTSSSPCPTPASGPRSASRSNPASRSSWGSSGTTTSAARSSSRARVSGTSASG